jgi:glycosyltransferase involved in cell wall biosynthesis
MVRNGASLSIVVPCFNEQEVLAETNRRLTELLGALRQKGLVSADSHIVYVDDGSTDGTWNLVQRLAGADGRIRGVKLARNRGHQAALLAGLFTAAGDAIVSIDADLQDDLNAIEKMLIEFGKGAEVVYGVRGSRTVDSRFKRNSAQFFYRAMRWMGVDLVHDHADFRLLGRRAILALREFGEVNLFLRGIVPLIGYRSVTVTYDRAERFAGQSKYPLRKMLSFAWEGITSFSVVPLRLITLFGVLVSLFSFAMIAYIIYGTLVLKAVVPGWASSVVPIYFLGGIQLLSTGILGEYVAKIYMESKRRPRFVIEQTI